jgi:hypothetical protein
MVVQWFANRTELYLAFATELRRAGLRVELYPDAPADDGKKVGQAVQVCGGEGDPLRCGDRCR